MSFLHFGVYGGSTPWPFQCCARIAPKIHPISHVSGQQNGADLFLLDFPSMQQIQTQLVKTHGTRRQNKK
jgi:hypothetical protein